MRSWFSLAALLLVVLAVGAWVYYKPAANVAETHALSALKPADVKRLRLERAAQGKAAEHDERGNPGQVLALVRENGDWLMTTPFAARAEKIPVERMLTVLDARSAVRYPVADLARYGLDKPQATLTLEDQTFAFGAINNMTREQYVLTRNDVYLVPLAYITALPRSADALLSLRLFGRDETPMRFELPEFSVALNSGTWAVSRITDEAGADERNSWVDAWRQASAIRAARSENPAPSQEIKVELKDGRVIRLGVLQREPELVLVRRDEGIEYHFFDGSGKKLLAPPGASDRERANK
jgi:hypothetical protein